MSELQITPAAFAIHRAGENPVTSKSAIRIELADEGGCPFLVVKSADIDNRNELRLNPEELDALCNAGWRLISWSK